MTASIISCTHFVKIFVSNIRWWSDMRSSWRRWTLKSPWSSQHCNPWSWSRRPTDASRICLRSRCHHLERASHQGGAECPVGAWCRGFQCVLKQTTRSEPKKEAPPKESYVSRLAHRLVIVRYLLSTSGIALMLTNFPSLLMALMSYKGLALQMTVYPFGGGGGGFWLLGCLWGVWTQTGFIAWP